MISVSILRSGFIFLLESVLLLNHLLCFPADERDKKDPKQQTNVLVSCLREQRQQHKIKTPAAKNRGRSTKYDLEGEESAKLIATYISPQPF